MNWSIATNEQIKVVINHDGQCPAALLYQALEEAVRRDLYKNFMFDLIQRRFRSMEFAEYILKTPFDELKQILYIVGFKALESYSPGKNSFFSFWMRFMNTKLSEISRAHGAQKRQGETTSIDLVTQDDEDYQIQLVSDINVERLIINRMFISELLSRLTPLEKEVVLLREQGYTFIEIGEKFGFTPGYMNKAHKAAFKKMKEGA